LGDFEAFMRTIVRAVALAAAAFLLANTTAAQPAAPVTAPGLDEFLLEPAMSAVELSPSGRYVAYARARGTERSIVIYDLETDKVVKVVNGLEEQGVSYNWLHWKDDRRLLISYTVVRLYRRGNAADGDVHKVDIGAGIISTDREQPGQVLLLGATDAVNRYQINKGQVLDLLRDDPDHILMLAYNKRDKPAAWRVNVLTGEGEIVEQGSSRTITWETDRSGRIVARWDSGERQGGWVALMVRGSDAADYTEAFRMRPKDLEGLPDLDFVATTDKPGQLYALVKPRDASEGDTVAVRIFDFNTRTFGSVLWRHPQYDVSGIVTAPGSDALAGACYTADVFRCDFTDPRMAATYKGLAAYFPDRSIRPVSESDDRSKTVLLVTGPDQPGAYFLYDWTKKEVRELGTSRPHLVRRLGSMERVNWTAADGTSLSGYLTLPPNAPANASGARLPLVVMPHGGPEARDSYAYNLWGQFLATRGYAVFQPNFRGSSGFGRRFAEAGYGQWGGTMQSDVESGVQHLIDTGRVDPGRMCIFGASYGGYVALYAGASQPGRYRCVASFAGVSDLTESVTRDCRYFGRDSATCAYWMKSIGDPGSQRARLDALSPVNMAAAFRAPVLLVHGEYDDNVLADQSRDMERALKRAGKPVKLVILKEAGHSGWTDDNMRLALSELDAFLAQHLGAQSGPG